LDAKTEKYIQYVENNLRQSYFLSDQVPPMKKLSKVKGTDRKIQFKSPKKQEVKVAEDQVLDDINKEISEKPLPDSDKIDPFLLRIDKLDKLDLASVEE
jgi:hypothetical protein